MKQAFRYSTETHSSSSLSSVVQVEVQSTMHSNFVCTCFYFLNEKREVVHTLKLFGATDSKMTAKDMIEILETRNAEEDTV